MENGRRNLADLSWFELVCVFAELLGADLQINYSGGYSCRIDYRYTTGEGFRRCTGLARTADSAEESAEYFLHKVFSHMSTLNFPGLKLPELSFGTKEDLAVKLAAAGVDPEFSLTHRAG